MIYLHFLFVILDYLTNDVTKNIIGQKNIKKQLKNAQKKLYNVKSCNDSGLIV